MFEYSKLILQKVSFDKLLFKKEFLKALKWLNINEVNQLLIWTKNNFSEIYTEIAKEIMCDNKILIKIKSDN